ncbi:guanine nucleotide exchange factor DBS-like [Micropterus salmoides]|uniref:guanine nucleotide exchange factor DBS-like n=1 Tax=Micropterus salmoides TaxID=27706 RepID=UPI0018EE1B9E|nr:guanine nucleotide exchange factor DBS-like [Micropterus salmoides]
MRQVILFSLPVEMKVVREGEKNRHGNRMKECAGKQEYGRERFVCISLKEMESYYRYSRCCQQLLHDDVLQSEDGPLCAAEIGSELQKQFAILPGGRGMNGSPIVIFPEFPAFSELEDEEVQNVLRYLTSVPSVAASGVGFILVIDRRLDRWAAVRATLLRIAGSFPGNLHLVLVLRPTTLLQRTLSDFLFKYNKDEFKMKVVMLSSVTELHAYIDPGQLTTELGGTQEYCHDSWISHRTAIEAFALMVKTTAQTLQTFGTELAETELPNDAEATTNLLHTHTLKKDKMKEDLQVALSQGGRLLECINEPLQTDPEYNMTYDEQENLDTVQRQVFADYEKLLHSENYVTKRQSLKLLGELLLDRHNFTVMTRYISKPENLKLMMNLLRDKSPNIQFEAFHVFKVFVANPNKTQPIIDILLKNQTKLIDFLSNFQKERTDDEQFNDEKTYLIKQIRDLKKPAS